MNGFLKTLYYEIPVCSTGLIIIVVALFIVGNNADDQFAFVLLQTSIDFRIGDKKSEIL